MSFKFSRWIVASDRNKDMRFIRNVPTIKLYRFFISYTQYYANRAIIRSWRNSIPMLLNQESTSFLGNNQIGRALLEYSALFMQRENKRNRHCRSGFPDGSYHRIVARACRQFVQNVPIINLPRSQCSARMQRTSATCYFAYNDAAVHANARNHPGDDIKRDRRCRLRHYHTVACD